MKKPAELIDYCPINNRPPIKWPNNARVAFWVIPNVEFYEYQPRPAGLASLMSVKYSPIPAPNVNFYAHQDYGNRVGFWRMLEVLDKHKIRCTVNINLALHDHHPEIRDAMVERNWDFCCHGFYNTGPEPRNLSLEEERAFIREAKDALKRTTGKQLKGFNVLQRCTEWTPELLAEEGIIYHADWFHDDQPTPIRTSTGKLVSVPYSMELNDTLLFLFNRPSEGKEWVRMCKDQFDRLYEEGAEDGRVYCIVLHPWGVGFPHRAPFLDEVLDYVMSHDGVWQTTADDIAEYYIANYYDQMVAHCEELKNPLR